MIKLLNGDCLQLLKELPPNCIDLILSDPPYGSTIAKWDKILPIEIMWESLKKVRKENTPTILFGNEPFSSYVRIANINEYKYDLIWQKSRITNFLFTKIQFGRNFEKIMIFYKKQCTFNPIMWKSTPYNSKGRHSNKSKSLLVIKKNIVKDCSDGMRYPLSILDFPFHNVGNIHPTQKPTDLLEYLIKTFSNENDTVLDFTMGSGSTGVACVNTNRKFIGIELDKYYFEKTKERIDNAILLKKGRLF